MKKEVYEKVVKNFLNKEKCLSKYACLSKDSIRIDNEDLSDIRPSFYRDVDRIIHSLSYTRYIDKTQVFSFKSNDHITKRIIHVQLVSKVARTIGRALNLNEDLIEAIALGHDIGHTPIGHNGEYILNDLCTEKNNTLFNHNIQSVKTLMKIENNGLGHNLSIQVLDGIMCHNGEIACNIYTPNYNKTLDDFLDEYKKSYVDKDVLNHLVPMTLEGCVVRISDIIAYLGRDIEDAIRIGVIKRSDIPTDIVKILGDNNKDIVNNIVLDIIENSLDKNYIKLSDDIFKALFKLKEFNGINIYYKSNTKEDIKRYRKHIYSLYDKYYSDIANNNTKSDIFTLFLNNMNKKYLNSNNIHDYVIDFIAGMTDDFFINEK